MRYVYAKWIVRHNLANYFYAPKLFYYMGQFSNISTSFSTIQYNEKRVDKY